MAPSSAALSSVAAGQTSLERVHLVARWWVAHDHLVAHLASAVVDLLALVVVARQT